MNKKGIYFTFIIFLLATLILVTSIGFYQAGSQQKQGLIDETAFSAVNTGFENIKNEIITLKTGYPGRQQSRILTAFDFDGGNDQCPDDEDKICGWTQIAQKIPQDPDALEDPFDALNLYEIFAESEEIQDDLEIGLTVARSADWGGTAERLEYLILPQCIKYHPDTVDLGSNMMGIYSAGEASDGCTFDISSIRMIEVSIIVETDDETPVALKKLAGKGDLSGDPAPTDPFDPANPLPYLKIEVNIPDCQPFPSCSNECCIIDGYGVISGHVDPLENNGFELQLDVGDPIDFYILSDNYLDDPPNPPYIVVAEDKENHRLAMSISRITFDEPITNAVFNAVTNISVQKEGFENLERGTD